jgi:hypothetical protein
MKDWRFEITGGLEVAAGFQVLEAADGQVIGFRLKDGRTVRLCLCLEVESEGGEKFDYVWKEAEMDALGFSGLEYDKTDFH